MLDALLSPHALPVESTPHRLNGIRAVEPGETVTLADLEGPGCIRHFFITMPPRELRKHTLRFYWDDESVPSVECPVSDFFGIGHDDTTAQMSNLLFYIAPKYGYNCYIPMPFAKRARITITNEAATKMPAVYLMASIDRYADGTEMPPWRFHVAWRRVHPAYRRGAALTLLEAKGDGKLLGTIYHVCKRDSDDRWSHGGGDQIFIDGETANPGFLNGVGGEDFAHHAWGLFPGQGPYSGAHSIHPLPGVKEAEGPIPFESHGWEQHDGGRYSMHRFFLPDPIRFRHSLRMTFGTCANEISATSYWYQTEPHQACCTLPAPDRRALGVRIAEEETWKPLAFPTVPVAVLGPTPLTHNLGWVPAQPADLQATYESGLDVPYADTFKPPWTIGWRRSEVRGGFLDIMAIHRAKTHLRARGQWQARNLPYPIASYQLLRVTTQHARQIVLRCGFEDQLHIYVNGKQAGAHHRPEPQIWGLEDTRVDLRQGANDIVLMTTQERLSRWSCWTISIHFLEPNLTLATGLTFDTFSTLDPTPERWRENWPPNEDIHFDTGADPLYLR